jgi:hypothetical protein
VEINFLQHGGAFLNGGGLLTNSAHGEEYQQFRKECCQSKVAI